jgi:methionyl aminopeptidase
MKRSDIIKYYNYLNDDVMIRLKIIGLGRINKYKYNYLDKLSLKTIPSYFHIDENKGLNFHPYQNNMINVIRTKKELVKIYDVNKKMSTIMSSIDSLMHEGIDISTIDEYLYKNICSAGLFPSMFGLDNFPKSSSISVNDIICHSVPYHYNLKGGDIVSVDVCGYNGFHTDMASTYCIGKCKGVDLKLVSTTKDALYNALHVCKEGAYYSDIGKIVEKTATENGFHVIKQFRGHGIGKNLHMKPFIPNYHDILLANKNERMKIGHMFAIEPLLCVGKGKPKLLEDRFGYVMDDGSNSAHFERVVLITENGYEILNDF